MMLQIPHIVLVLSTFCPVILASPIVPAAAIASAPSLVASSGPDGLNCTSGTHDLLKNAADAWVTALNGGLATTIHSWSAQNWTYKENNKQLQLDTTTLLSKRLQFEHRRTNFDLTTCATYTELISSSQQYVIGTQIHHNPDGYINSIDSVVTTTGAWIFNATKTLEWVNKENWTEIEEGKRDKRDVIKAAGDAWLDLWSDKTAESRIPWGTPCSRLEGSAYTGKGAADDSCKPGIPTNHSQAPNVDRRYVIDEAMGSVSILCVWQHTKPVAADSHEFRLENGKLRYVHTMTTCGDVACKL